jgi:hypothetical protein
MDLSKQNEYQIMLFEEYIEALVDRRIQHTASPESNLIFENKVVAAARTIFIEEVFRDLLYSI